MRPPRPPANSAQRSMWPQRVVLSLRGFGVAWCGLQNANALCYSWTAVHNDLPVVVEHHNGDQGGRYGKKRSAKELRNRGLEDMANGCNAGDSSRPVGLYAKSGCAETILQCHVNVSVYGSSVVRTLTHHIHIYKCVFFFCL